MRFLYLIIVVSLLTGCQQSTVDKKAAAWQSNYVSQVWRPDNGDGTYRNPIIHADYSDPDVVRVGDDFYMTASSFNCSPALPILHSKDLVNWQLVSHALRRNTPADVFAKPQHGKGVWAPCIRYRQDEFYIYWGDPDFGVYMIKAKDPLGRWSDPVLVLPGKGIIDPCPLWDEDGNTYLVTAWAGSRAGFNSILTVWRMNAGGTEVIDHGKHVFDGHDRHHTVEGPKFYKRQGYYYIFAPAGGVAEGWQLALRSKDIYGPYEEKVVMAQGRTDINGPHQGGYVETQTGEPWFLHFQDKGAYGRIIHLNPVSWVDGWPVIGMDGDGDLCGEPVHAHAKPNVGRAWPAANPAESDGFDTDTLGLQWQWAANERPNWSVLLRGKGYLRLFAWPGPEAGMRLWDLPNVLMQKFPAPGFTATAKIKFTVEWDVWQGKQTGLVVMGNDYAYLSLGKDERGYKVRQVVCKDANTGGTESVVAEARVSTNELYLRVDVTAPDAGCRFSFSEDGTAFTPIGGEHMARPELWIGAKIGLFATAEPGFRNGGYADVDWVRIERQTGK
ncbi:MAG: glycoside hydrolase 43 family protein [Breznakibacter sp.]